MMLKVSHSVTALGAILMLMACESNGSTRFASVGQTGAQGQAANPGAQGPAGQDGAAGPQGPAGATGAQGPAGPQGEAGGNFALGSTGMIATGGLVGPSGVGGTGLLANLGDPSTTIPGVSPVIGGAGSAVSTLGGQLEQLPLPQDGSVALAGLTQAASGTLVNLGDALTATGYEGAPLTDGLTSAVSPLLTAGVGGGTVAGDSGDASLLGLSVLSPDQQPGTLAELGLASDATLLNVDLAPSSDGGIALGDLATVDLGPVTGGLGGLGDLGDNSATGLVGTLLDPVTGEAGSAPLPTTPLIGGLLGGLGGGSN